MLEAKPPRQHLFIVRIWIEAGQSALSQWRGSVEHVPSGQRLYFVSLGDLNDFMLGRLGGPPIQEQPEQKTGQDRGKRL